TASPTPTATFTSTPTTTATSTATSTPTPVCTPNYTITARSGARLPGKTDIGNHCDDCNNNIALPFPVTPYNQTFNSVNASSNGNLQFLSNDSTFTNTCLPYFAFNFAILPHWDDLRTDGAGEGVFTLLTGPPGSQTFYIEWRTHYFSGAGTANFEVVLHENSTNFEVIYGVVTQGGSSATVGVQRDTGSQFTQFECNTGGLTSGLQLLFTEPPCGTPTPTPTATASATATFTPTPTATAT